MFLRKASGPLVRGVENEGCSDGESEPARCIPSSSCYVLQHRPVDPITPASPWRAADQESRGFCLHSCIILGAAGSFGEVLALALN